MNVGDYVRYRCAYDNTIKIKKINAIVPPDNLIKENYYKFDDYEGTIEKCIIKSSPNIIDLIETGDYVNGEKVYYLKGQINEKEVAYEEDVLYTEYIDEYGEWYGYSEDEIESIVTHEQFESMEYKL